MGRAAWPGGGAAAAVAPPGVAAGLCRPAWLAWWGKRMSEACAGVRRGYRARITSTARAPPMIWAAMNAGTEDGAIPAKVAENIRPTVMAGLAKLVEDVKKYAAPIYAPTAAGADRRPSRAGQREDHQDQPEGGDHLGQEMRGRGPVLRGDTDRRLGEHQVRQDRADDAAGHLRGQVGRGVAPAQPAERRIRERHHRVEMGAGHRPEHQDDGEQPRRRRRRVLQQLQARGARGQALRGDPRADHDRGQEAAAEELGSQPAPQRDRFRWRCPGHSAHLDGER